MKRWLDRLERLPAWAFGPAVWMVRWPVVLLASAVQRALVGSPEEPAATVSSPASADALALLLLGTGPAFEILVECLLPWLVLSALRRRRGQPMP